MQAVVWTRYGPPEVLQIGEIDKPSPKDDQIVVKVAVSNVFAGDIDCGFHMANVVDAHRYVESGKRIGNVVLQIAGYGHAAPAEPRKRLQVPAIGLRL